VRGDRVAGRGRRRFAVVDRDGTVIVNRPYLADPEGVELLPGAAAGLRALQVLGLGLVIVTNQSGVARGDIPLAALEGIHRRLREVLAAEGVELDGIYHCPHLPDDGCACRKPGPALVHRAASELGFEPSAVFVIGDDRCDVELGRRLGASCLLVRTGHGAAVAARVPPSVEVVEDLRSAAAVIRRLLA
jgi:D-glycero-D-manno-heptose 1,7-bisphosphate phosphatase